LNQNCLDLVKLFEFKRWPHWRCSCSVEPKSV
jgi:hypothetical protein